jgi:hypothetical protein
VKREEVLSEIGQVIPYFLVSLLSVWCVLLCCVLRWHGCTCVLDYLYGFHFNLFEERKELPNMQLT